MNIESLAKHGHQISEFLSQEFVFPMNFMVAEPALIIIFSTIFVLVGFILSALGGATAVDKHFHRRNYGWLLLGIGAPITLSGLINSYLLFTSPADAWANTAGQESYARVSEFFNDTARHSLSPFDVSDPSRLKIISLMRVVQREVNRATSDEITRRLLENKLVPE